MPFSSSFSDKHTPHTGTRGHFHTSIHALTNIRTLPFQFVVSPYTLTYAHWGSFVWLWVAECGARSLTACQGTRQLSPQTHPVLRGKRQWGKRPCFWGNLEFATFSWVTIHSRSNSRLANVMFFSISPSLPLSPFLFFLCLTLFCSPCSSYHSNFEKLDLLKALVSVCSVWFWVDFERLFMIACLRVCVCLH